MGTSEQLRVRVNDKLVLDAGACEEISGPPGPECLLRPPATTVFHQALAYIQAQPDPPERVFPREGDRAGWMVGREGVAAAALTLRWGSYLAVLLDHDKPVWPEVHAERMSRISDSEMARINIVASAGLAAWIELRRKDEGVYRQLVNRAVSYLPMPTRTSKANVGVGAFPALADPTRANRLVHAVDPERLTRMRADVGDHPSRVFANALVNVAWRNGPVEDVHAGSFPRYRSRSGG